MYQGLCGLMQRMKHVGSQRESELKMLLAGMHQPKDHSPDSQWDPIEALQSLNNIITLPGCGASAPHEQLRLQSIKVPTSHLLSNYLINFALCSPRPWKCSHPSAAGPDHQGAGYPPLRVGQTTYVYYFLLLP